MSVQVAMSSPLPSSPPSPSPPPKVKHRRTRTGCLCCRLRKKKCDGQRPTCVACDRNSLICSWGASPTTSGGVRAASPASASGSVASEGSIASASASVSASSPSSSSSSSPSNTPASMTATASPPSFSPPALGLGLLGQALMKPEHAFVYRNYVARTANTVSALQDAANPFLRLLVPLAAADGVIRDAMLALSAVHLWKSPEPVPGAERLTSTYATLAVRGLKYGLTRARAEGQVDTALVVGSLLLSLVEAMKGESNYQTTLHLRGCSSLLRSWVATPQAAAVPDLRAFVVELYLYLAISMGIPLGVSGAGSHEYVVQDAGALFPYVRAAATAEQRAGPLLGCAHALFALIPQIYALGEAAGTETNASAGAGTGTDTDTDTYRALVDTLFAWQPPPGASRDCVLAARVYQQALLVFLMLSLQDCLDLDPATVDPPAIVDQAFAVAGAALAALPLGAPSATTLTWPLAVLGAASRAPAHQAIVRGRLRHLRQTLHWAVFDQVLRVLEALWADGRWWEDPSRPPGMDGFEAVMRQLDMHVLLS